MSDQKPKLTTKQRCFVAAYLGEAAGCAAKAAKLAGYSNHRKAAFEVPRHPGVRAAIDAALAQIETEGLAQKRMRLVAQMERHRILSEELHRRAYNEDGEPLPLMDGRGYKADAALFAEIRALEDIIAAETGQRKATVEHSGPNGAPLTPVVIYLPDNGRDTVNPTPAGASVDLPV